MKTEQELQTLKDTIREYFKTYDQSESIMMSATFHNKERLAEVVKNRKELKAKIEELIK